MQFHKPAGSKSSLDKCIETRINELTNRLQGVKKKRFKYFEVKYDSEIERLLDLVGALKKGMFRINEMYSEFLNIPFISSDRKEAVVSAILRNAFAEKKVIDHIYRNLQKSHACAEYDLHRFLQIVSPVVYGNPSATDETDAEGMLANLSKHVVSINENISEIHEKCFQFLCTFETALKMIKGVVEGGGKQVNFNMTV